MTLIVNEMGEGQMANDIHLNTDIVNQITVHKNLSQEIIVINIDKVKLILNEHQKKVQKKIDLINPLALFLLRCRMIAFFQQHLILIWKR